MEGSDQNRGYHGDHQICRYIGSNTPGPGKCQIPWAITHKAEARDRSPYDKAIPQSNENTPKDRTSTHTENLPQWNTGDQS